MQGVPDDSEWRDVDLDKYRLPTIDKEKSVPLQKEMDDTDKLSRRLFRLQFIIGSISFIALCTFLLTGMRYQSPELDNRVDVQSKLAL